MSCTVGAFGEFGEKPNRRKAVQICKYPIQTQASLFLQLRVIKWLESCL